MANPRVDFSFDKAPPPGALYVGPNDHFLVNTWCSVASVTLDIAVRMLLPDGIIHTNRFSFPLNSDRSVTTDSFALPEGFILSVLAGSNGAVLVPGQCWILCRLARGAPNVGTAHQTLIADYVHDMLDLSYPAGILRHPTSGAGVIRSITGTNPAVNTEISQTVPTNARWQLLAIEFNLVTDINAADRFVRLTFDDGATIFYTIEALAAHTASLTRGYSYAINGQQQTVVSSLFNFPLPHLFLNAGFKITTATGGRQAGDDFAAPQLLVQEWIVE